MINLIKKSIKKLHRLSLYLSKCEIASWAGKFNDIYTKAQKGVHIIIFPYHWKGDAMYVFSHLRSYLKIKGIQQFEIYVLNKRIALIAELFDFNATVLNSNVMAKLMKVMNILHENPNFHIMHHDPLFSKYNHANKFFGSKDMHLGKMLDICALDNLSCEIEKPKKVITNNEAVEILEKKGLVPGKTVILAPYAYTLKKIDISFWKLLSDNLKMLGYSVCCNVSSEEKGIPGINKLNLDLGKFLVVCEEAGYFVGVRSGLCDLLVFSDCCKIALYNYASYEAQSKFFSFETMWENSEFNELYFGNNIDNNTNNNIEEIIKIITSRGMV